MSTIEENDFIIAIQAILTKAKESGWSIEKVTQTAHEAIEEFELEEFIKQESGDEDEFEEEE